MRRERDALDEQAWLGRFSNRLGFFALDHVAGVVDCRRNLSRLELEAGERDAEKVKWVQIKGGFYFFSFGGTRGEQMNFILFPPNLFFIQVSPTAFNYNA